MASRDPSVLMRAAYLYYVEGKSQAEVAKALGTGRPNVSRILAEAQRQGIVEIRINDPAGRDRELETQLRDRFGLADVRVARRGFVQGARIEDRVGVLAAGLLLESLRDGLTVAMSWGRSLQATVYSVDSQQDHDVTLVQLLGGMSALANEISGQELTRELAVRLGASYQLIHAPAALDSADAARTLLAESSIAASIAQAREADLALVGVGAPTAGSSSAVIDSMHLNAEELADFWAARPVGDVAGRYYDLDGQPVGGVVDDRVVAVTLADLDRIPQVVGIVVGRAKTQAVLGGLHGHHFDALVCDESLARSVLSASHDPAPSPPPTPKPPFPGGRREEGPGHLRHRRRHVHDGGVLDS